MHELQTFVFERQEAGFALPDVCLPIRVALVAGEPWWVAADVCGALDIQNPTDALTRLDDDEKGTLDSNEGGPGRRIVNEPGLYSLILGSRKPEAKAFKRWITHEVLPAIRKTGAYNVAPLDPTYRVGDLEMRVPRSMSEALRGMATLADKVQDQHQVIQTLEPKAAFHDQVAEAKNALPVAEVAKLLKSGEVRFFRWLRSQGFLMHDNKPYQQYLDRGYFVLVEGTYRAVGNNEPRAYTKTMITGKGQAFLAERFRVSA